MEFSEEGLAGFFSTVFPLLDERQRRLTGAATERSPNTVRAYASSLRMWFEYLAGRDVRWDRVGLDDVGRFVSWLRAPAVGVIVIDAGTAGRAVATVNRHLAAVFGL